MKPVRMPEKYRAMFAKKNGEERWRLAWDENGGEGWCRRGQTPPSTTTGLVVCGRLD